MKFCINCDKELSTHQYKFCGNKCQMSYQYKNYIVKWKEGESKETRGKYQVSDYIRRYLFEKYKNKCCSCGWHEINIFTENIPLEVHHIDGDYTNNKEDNLELLCPNCHSLTETYKASNMGKGRLNREKYNK